MSFSRRLPIPKYDYGHPVVNTAHFPEFTVTRMDSEDTGDGHEKNLRLTVRLPYTVDYSIDGINKNASIPVQQYKDVIINIVDSVNR